MVAEVVAVAAPSQIKAPVLGVVAVVAVRALTVVAEAPAAVVVAEVAEAERLVLAVVGVAQQVVVWEAPAVGVVQEDLLVAPDAQNLTEQVAPVAVLASTSLVIRL